ncbi:DHX57, partial [Symbiodinium sp. CCMP2456]
MSITLSVSLLSGRSVSVEAEPEDAILLLRQRAQSVLGVGAGVLLHSTGSLDEAATVQEAGLKNGDELTYQVRRVSLCDNPGAFAAILSDGSVVTWGHADFGGESSSVQPKLNCVRQIQSCFSAFAAILGDGSVVPLGPRLGVMYILLHTV